MKHKLLTHIMLWCAVRLGYDHISIYVPEGTDDVIALHLAADEAAMNTSMRLYVESLDERSPS